MISKMDFGIQKIPNQAKLYFEELKQNKAKSVVKLVIIVRDKVLLIERLNKSTKYNLSNRFKSKALSA